jgi:hypothetical protein
MPYARASSPRSNANWSTATAPPPGPRRRSPCSSCGLSRPHRGHGPCGPSRASPTRRAGTRPSAISYPPSSMPPTEPTVPRRTRPNPKPVRGSGPTLMRPETVGRTGAARGWSTASPQIGRASTRGPTSQGVPASSGPMPTRACAASTTLPGRFAPPPGGRLLAASVPRSPVPSNWWRLCAFLALAIGYGPSDTRSTAGPPAASSSRTAALRSTTPRPSVPWGPSASTGATGSSAAPRPETRPSYAP